MHLLPILHADRLFLAQGVETRMPFLDRRVVEAGLGLPQAAFSDRELGMEKPVVRALYLRAYGESPPDKQGFSGAGTPPPELLVSWVDERVERGLRFFDGELLRGLAADPRSWLRRNLAWRALLLEELYAVMRQAAVSPDREAA
jgi:hypothetical protein